MPFRSSSLNFRSLNQVPEPHPTNTMTNLEEPMDIDEGWKQIKAKAIDVLLEQLQQGFDEKARPFDVSI